MVHYRPTLTVLVEQSFRCVCACVQRVAFELNELWGRHLACWFTWPYLGQLRWSRWQRSRSRDEKCSFFGCGRTLRGDTHTSEHSRSSFATQRDALKCCWSGRCDLEWGFLAGLQRSSYHISRVKNAMRRQSIHRRRPRHLAYWLRYGRPNQSWPG